MIDGNSKCFIDEGLLDGFWTGDRQNRPVFFHVVDLTYRGHRFLEGAKNDAVWNRVMKGLVDSGKTLTIAVIAAVFTKAAVG